MAFKIALLLAVFAMLSCEKVYNPTYNGEKEPNNDVFNANEILMEGATYSGTIDHPYKLNGKMEGDIDVFELRAFPTKIYTLEFETAAGSFMPYAEITDEYGLSKFAFYKPGSKNIMEIFNPNGGGLYIAVGDAMNIHPENNKLYGGPDYRYYLRVTSRELCSEEIKETLFADNELSTDMLSPKGAIKYFRLPQLDGYYSIQVDSANKDKNKKMIIVDCFVKGVVTGNDDLDALSELYDPYIYKKFGGIHDFVTVVDDWLVDFNQSYTDGFTVKLTAQEHGKELEPNNSFEFANYIEGTSAEGFLDSEEKIIEGETQADKDFFRLDEVGGKVMNFMVQILDDGEVTAETHGYAYNVVGTSIIPLKKNTVGQAKGETLHFNALMPFTGTAYFTLQGAGINYKIDYSSSYPFEDIYDSGEKEYFSDKCQTVFINYHLPEINTPFTGKVRLSVRSDTSKAGLYIYRDNNRPFIYLDPVEKNYFYLLKYFSMGKPVLGAFLETCDPKNKNSIIIGIDEMPLALESVDFDKGGNHEIIPGTTYLGYFNSKKHFLENNFYFIPEKDGTIFISTAPYPDNGSPNIDTVLTVSDELGNELEKNDDMIESLSFNKYSFLRLDVVKGLKYMVKIKPFMDEDSNVDAMNIVGNYILDINLD